MNRKAEEWIARLELRPHPEGGYFRESYRSKEQVDGSALPERFEQPHHLSTAIYYLLADQQFSAFHRIKSDELWHFYDGTGLTIHVFNPSGDYQKIALGKEPSLGELPQATVKAGSWFAAEVSSENGFGLVGCTVAPGFEFDDFELAAADDLIPAASDHRDLIERFTPPG